jgi:polycomb protein EED
MYFIKVDRRIKLWHVHPRNSKQITREDKPLFSSSRIHRSRVLSVRWLTHDTLISHCPSAVMRTDPLDAAENKDTYLVPGEITVWKWLGLNRFFPPRYDEMRLEGKTQSVLRGCASVSNMFLLLLSFEF